MSRGIRYRGVGVRYKNIVAVIDEGTVGARYDDTLGILGIR